MPKGHSLLEPRITQLEEMEALNRTISREANNRITALEAEVAELKQLFAPMPAGTQPDQFVMKERYKPLFDKWPGNGSGQ